MAVAGQPAGPGPARLWGSPHRRPLGDHGGPLLPRRQVSGGSGEVGLGWGGGRSGSPPMGPGKKARQGGRVGVPSEIAFVAVGVQS